MNAQASALPDAYYLIFCYYEPIIGLLSTTASFANPKLAHDNSGPWPDNIPPKGPLPKPTELLILSLSHVCFVISLLNLFFLRSARHLLRKDPALQEKVVGSFLGTLLFGDVAHMGISLWAWGEDRWDVRKWRPVMWAVIGVGSSLLVPRVCWWLGVGRYVHKRDGAKIDR